MKARNFPADFKRFFKLRVELLSGGTQACM